MSEVTLSPDLSCQRNQLSLLSPSYESSRFPSLFMRHLRGDEVDPSLAQRVAPLLGAADSQVYAAMLEGGFDVLLWTAGEQCLAHSCVFSQEDGSIAIYELWVDRSIRTEDALCALLQDVIAWGKETEHMLLFVRCQAALYYLPTLEAQQEALKVLVSTAAGTVQLQELATQ